VSGKQKRAIKQQSNTNAMKLFSKWKLSTNKSNTATNVHHFTGKWNLSGRDWKDFWTQADLYYSY